MVTAIEHPTVSRVWTMHEEIRQDVGCIRSLIADLSEVEDEDGGTSPTTGSGRIRRLVTELVARLHQLERLHETDRDLTTSFVSRPAHCEEWLKLMENREWIHQSLQVLIELLGSMDRPDTTSWTEIERRFAVSARMLCSCLTEEFDLVRRCLETSELAVTRP